MGEVHLEGAAVHVQGCSSLRSHTARRLEQGYLAL